MKRLIKKAEPITLYHGTNLLSLDGILQTGIEAGRVENSPFYITTINKTFYATEIKTAISYGENKFLQEGGTKRDGIMVIQVLLDTEYLEPDNDDTNAKTWQESGGQVSIDGSISAQQIEHLYFYNDKKQLVVHCPKEEYLNNSETIKQQVYQSNTTNDHDEMVKGDITSEELLDVLKKINKKITRCKDIIELFDDYSDPNDMVQEKLNIHQNKIILLVEEANKLILDYNNQGNQLPFISVEKSSYKRFDDDDEDYDYYDDDDELEGLTVTWFNDNFCTWINSSCSSEEKLISNFTNYLKDKINK